MTKILAPVIGVILVAGLVFGIKGATGFYDDKTKVCTVDSKNRNVAYDREGNREVQMLVYTRECGTFEVGDSLIKGKFRSADTFGSLREGHRYELKYHGWRNGFLSAFPTITEAKEVA